jgi:hypothetical protein
MFWDFRRRRKKICIPIKISRTIIRAAETGRSKKIKGLPLDIRRDWRKALSEIVPRTKARRSGPGSKASLRKM